MDLNRGTKSALLPQRLRLYARWFMLAGYKARVLKLSAFSMICASGLIGSLVLTSGALYRSIAIGTTIDSIEYGVDLVGLVIAAIICTAFFVKKYRLHGFPRY
jgi:hypothetical protein